jgi:hypothetical protein
MDTCVTFITFTTMDNAISISIHIPFWDHAAIPLGLYLEVELS